MRTGTARVLVAAVVLGDLGPGRRHLRKEACVFAALLSRTPQTC